MIKTSMLIILLLDKEFYREYTEEIESLKNELSELKLLLRKERGDLIGYINRGGLEVLTQEKSEYDKSLVEEIENNKA